MSNSLDPDQARPMVWPDLGPNCLLRLSADDTGRQRLHISALLCKNRINALDSVQNNPNGLYFCQCVYIQ